MKKLLILIFLLPVTLMAQNRALRIDSLHCSSDAGVGTWLPASGSLTVGDRDNLMSIYVTSEHTHIASGVDSLARIWVDDGYGKIYLIAGDADSLTLACNSDSAIIHSNNPISVDNTVIFWGTISAAVLTDRTKYFGEKEAIRVLKKINLSQVAKLENQDDVFVLPYELREKEYRNVSNCVSLLLAVAKSQQAEIEALKKQIKKVK